MYGVIYFRSCPAKGAKTEQTRVVVTKTFAMAAKRRDTATIAKKDASALLFVCPLTTTAGTRVHLGASHTSRSQNRPAAYCWNSASISIFPTHPRHANSVAGWVKQSTNGRLHLGVFFATNCQKSKKKRAFLTTKNLLVIIKKQRN